MDMLGLGACAMSQCLLVSCCQDSPMEYLLRELQECVCMLDNRLCTADAVMYVRQGEAEGPEPQPVRERDTGAGCIQLCL